MATELNNKELNEILAENIANIRKERTTEVIRLSDSIANQIGKITKLATLSLVYDAHLKSGGRKIAALERPADESKQ